MLIRTTKRKKNCEKSQCREVKIRREVREKNMDIFSRLVKLKGVVSKS